MAVALLWGGIAIYLVGWVWLIYLAWSNDRVGMAVGIFFLAPIFGLIYLLSNFDEAKIPYGLVVVGFVMRVAGILLASP